MTNRESEEQTNGQLLFKYSDKLHVLALFFVFVVCEALGVAMMVGGYTLLFDGETDVCGLFLATMIMLLAPVSILGGWSKVYHWLSGNESWLELSDSKISWITDFKEDSVSISSVKCVDVYWAESVCSVEILKKDLSAVRIPTFCLGNLRAFSMAIKKHFPSIDVYYNSVRL